jgi:hypothetical protein
MLWRRLPEDLAKVGVEGSNPFARSKESMPWTTQIKSIVHPATIWQPIGRGSRALPRLSGDRG